MSHTAHALARAIVCVCVCACVEERGPRGHGVVAYVVLLAAAILLWTHLSPLQHEMTWLPFESRTM